MFVGRRKELKLLKEDFAFRENFLTVLLGRRGVGKTFLLTKLSKELMEEYENLVFFEFTGKKNVKAKDQGLIFIQEVYNKAKELLKDDKIFKNLLRKLNKDFEEYKKEIEREKSNALIWYSVFNYFQEIIELLKTQQVLIWKSETEETEMVKNKMPMKFLLFIDEFAWFNQRGGEFAEEFGVFWNKIKNNTYIYCVLSGSAISWMNKNVLKAKGSLYHKATEVIRMKPFTLEETIEYFDRNHFDFGFETKLQYYMLTGGVARYLDKIRSHLNLRENIEKIFFEMVNGEQKEFDNLFTSTFTNTRADAHKKIINLFIEGNKLTIKQIVKKLEGEISQSVVYNALKDLEVSDILLKIENVKNGNEPLYMLSDLFCFYHVKFFEKQKNNLAIFDEELLDKYNGYAFEILAFLNVDLIKQEIDRLGFKTVQYKYQSDEAQIDMVIDYGKNKYSIVECKHYNKPFVIDEKYEENLINKKEDFINFLKAKRKGKIEVDFVFFTVNGIKNRGGRFSYLNVPLKEIFETL